jgi:hypothetical protein
LKPWLDIFKLNKESRRHLIMNFLRRIYQKLSDFKWYLIGKGIYTLMLLDEIHKDFQKQMEEQKKKAQQ